MKEVRELEAEAARLFHGKHEEHQMTSPVQPVAGDPAPDAAAQAAAQAQLAEQAATVGGNPAAAGIYGDPAGASQPSQPLDPADLAAKSAAAGGTTGTDVDSLLTRLQALEDQLKAAADAEAAKQQAAEPKPPVLEEIVGALSGAAPGVVHALTVIASRLDAAGI